MNNISNVSFFIIHYTPLTDRKEYLTAQLNSLGIENYEWITEKDIEHYDLQAMYDTSQERFQKRLKTDFGKMHSGIFHQMKQNEIEVTAQHIEAIKRMHHRNLDHAIILEDDVVFDNKFIKKMNIYIKQLPQDYDIFYFGEGCGALHIKRNIKEKIQGAFGKKNVFKRNNCQSRYADSYMLSKKAIDRLTPLVDTFQFPIDWEMNYLQIKLSMNIYWGEPTLSFQGSSSGKFKSGLR